MAAKVAPYVHPVAPKWTFASNEGAQHRGGLPVELVCGRTSHIYASLGPSVVASSSCWRPDLVKWKIRRHRGGLEEEGVGSQVRSIDLIWYISMSGNPSNPILHAAVMIVNDDSRPINLHCIHVSSFK